MAGDARIAGNYCEEITECTAQSAMAYEYQRPDEWMGTIISCRCIMTWKERGVMRIDEDDAWLLLSILCWGNKDAEDALEVIRDEYFRRWGEIQELKKKRKLRLTP